MSHADYDLIAADQERMQDNIRHDVRVGRKGVAKEIAERMDIASVLWILENRGMTEAASEFRDEYNRVVGDLAEVYSIGPSVEARLDAVQRARDVIKELA